MTPRLRLLRGASILFFALTVFGYLIVSNITFASTRHEVRNPLGERIGEVWISHDYHRTNTVALMFVVLSGLQLWTVWEVTRLSARE